MIDTKVRIAGFLFAILIHLLPILYFIDFYREPERTVQSNRVTPHPVMIILLPKVNVSDDSNGEASGKKNTYFANLTICRNKDKHYRGIGVIYNGDTKMIMVAPEYYPGYKAGLRLDDYIVNAELKIVNGYIDIEVIRGYNSHRFSIKAEEICFNKE